MKQELTPTEIVQELDKHIIGQNDAKKSVAIALRNRWRRTRVDESLRNEITPKNILMIGPTGVGKTEIARRLAKISNAPFIKVEATKFTEVGYVGRDVDSIIRDLVEIATKMVREIALEKYADKAKDLAEERVLRALLPSAKNEDVSSNEYEETKQIFRKKLREGKLDDKEVEMQLAVAPIGIEIMSPPGMEEMTNQLQSMLQNLSADKKRTKKITVKEALKQATEEESHRLVNDEELRSEAISLVEENGIVFIDEIDKVTQHSSGKGGEVSREGVQRDLLPLIEGCTVNTKFGMIKTDHILFIASGAFHLSKPSDLIPELQGRLPIRVELKALTPEDFVQILTEPKASLIKQYKNLLATEDYNLTFEDSAIARIAELAWKINERTENIGARRLHTVMERLVEEVSFNASEQSGTSLTIDEKYVDAQIADLCEDEDLSRFIL